jgi:hypothetical protein
MESELSQIKRMYETLQKEVQRQQARSQQVTEERDSALSQI